MRDSSHKSHASHKVSHPSRRSSAAVLPGAAPFAGHREKTRRTVVDYVA